MLSNENLLNAQNEYITQLQVELDNLKEHFATLEQQEAELLKEYNSEIKHEVMLETQHLKEEIDALKRNNSELLTLNRNQAKTIVDLETRDNYYSSELSTLRARSTHLQSKIEQLEDSLRSAENAIAEKNEEIKRLRRASPDFNKTTKDIKAEKAAKDSDDKTVGTFKHYEDGKLVESHRITQEEADELEKEFNAEIAAMSERLTRATSFLNRILK